MKRNLILPILCITLLLRFYGLNWDADKHLHPDERFLTMVAVAMHIPAQFADYLNPAVSPMNPANVNYPFYVYGLFPLAFTKIAAVLLHDDTYIKLTLLGRGISAVLDLLVVLFIYKTVKLFEDVYHLDERVKYWSCFIYGLAVLPIQLAHFFAVDTFLSFFMFAAFYHALRYSFKHKPESIIISAVLFGLAMSSKITAVYILPLIIFFIAAAEIPLSSTVHSLLQLRLRDVPWEKFGVVTILVCTYIVIFSAVLRVANPYMFSSGNIFNFRLNPQFIMNIQQLKSFDNPNGWFPPALQWISKKAVLFSLTNIAMFGLGIGAFVFLLYGLWLTVIHFFKNRTTQALYFFIIACWTVGYFVYQSVQFVKVMRYFMPLYPFFALFAGYGIWHVSKKWRIRYISLLVIALMVWPLMFSSIYRHPHTRVEASEWLYDNIPANSVVLGEYWDDQLPLRIPGKVKPIAIGLVYPFQQDSPEKWVEMNKTLKQADYYVLSSNRAWASIMSVPDKYPIQSAYYRDLLSGKTPYIKIKEFTSYPSLEYLGIPLTLNDDWADEAFTVYDHPKVMIFKNTAK